MRGLSLPLFLLAAAAMVSPLLVLMAFMASRIAATLIFP